MYQNMEMYEVIKEFVKPELLILIPVLYLLGMALNILCLFKKSSRKLKKIEKKLKILSGMLKKVTEKRFLEKISFFFKIPLDFLNNTAILRVSTKYLWWL